MIPKDCKRLAEVDFPIAVVSTHAVREKAVRHGHPGTLHLWWARRPLAACRAMLLGLLLPDPCDVLCPEEFKVKTRELLPRVQGLVGTDDKSLQCGLLRFIGDFANWDLSSNAAYLEVSRGLVRAAYPLESPLIVDPFAGGGSIPLEALRLGCEAFASDLNPVACLILKTLLEDIPRHGLKLADELQQAGAEVRQAAEQEIANFYPTDPNGAQPVAYIWARTVRCESPNCGAEIPLVRSFWLAKKELWRKQKGRRIKIRGKQALCYKYDAASAELIIGEEHLWIERRWREPGAKSKVFVDGEGMAVRDFQQFLMQRLGIPSLNFPRGNPMSGQTWPELSFRMLLRHIHRQQRFWSGIADQQPEGEQHACLLQFLRLAEHVFTEEYGQLVHLKMEAEQLKARRDQYKQTLDDLARDLLSEPGLSVGANVTTVRDAENRLAREIEAHRKRRKALIMDGRDQVVSPEHLGHVAQLSEERATIMVTLEDLVRRAKETSQRLDTMRGYRAELGEELERITRAEDAGAVLADLKITHCPACDQTIANTPPDREHCSLCHQVLPDELPIEELGAVRLRFERERLTGEFKEADQLVSVLQRDTNRFASAIAEAEERLRMLENELAPARDAVAALIQEEVSAIDMALGELNERQRQLGRISAALGVGQQLTDRIAAIEREIEPLQANVDEAARATDFEAAASQLEDGMNAYLTAINNLRPGVWRHSPVVIDVSRYSFTFRVGARRWQAALGGTDSLYFLMAYHYGLLALSDKPERHYPGLSIIDVPGEFSGEAVEDKENFIVQPFIDLLAQEEYQGAQLIITGASFTGLNGAHRLHLTDVYVA